MTRRIAVLDTTLRDGEQSAGVAFTPEEKVEIALALERLGVDVIEAGFPATSPGEFAGVAQVAAAVTGAVVCAMARTHQGDIEAAAEALNGAARSRLHLVLGTSLIHRTRRLHLTTSELVTLARQSVESARPLFDEVQFCCEDASRTEPDVLAEVCATVVDAGADVLTLPDTVGYAIPNEYARLFAQAQRSHFLVPLSAHCHDDLGLATANTLAAVDAGAAQVECTVNGIGERAGNAALEEVATVLEMQGLRTNLDLKSIEQVSRLVSSLSGLPIARHKAIVGVNVTASAPSEHEPAR